MSAINCCSGQHPWDLYNVPINWCPLKPRCPIIGENPGDVGSPYFYDETQSVGYDPIAVRRNLLFGLHKVGLIDAPTLHAFQQAGFLFDHAIRCHLPPATVENQGESGSAVAGDKR